LFSPQFRRGGKDSTATATIQWAVLVERCKMQHYHSSKLLLLLLLLSHSLQYEYVKRSTSIDLLIHHHPFPIMSCTTTTNNTTNKTNVIHTAPVDLNTLLLLQQQAQPQQLLTTETVQLPVLLPPVFWIVTANWAKVSCMMINTAWSCGRTFCSQNFTCCSSTAAAALAAAAAAKVEVLSILYINCPNKCVRLECWWNKNQQQRQRQQQQPRRKSCYRVHSYALGTMAFKSFTLATTIDPGRP
jgi:hypothetical protein